MWVEPLDFIIKTVNIIILIICSQLAVDYKISHADNSKPKHIIVVFV